MTPEKTLVQQLRAFYPEHIWVLLSQVRSGTGAGSGRTADALAMNCWPSRGMELHGFEVKFSRADWLRELKKPEKAEAICAYCDRWYVVARAASVVKARELPPTWGLIVLDDNPRVEVEAPALIAHALDRAFIAAVLRSVARDVGIPPDDVQRLTKKTWDEAYKAGVLAGSSTDRRHQLRWERDSLVVLETAAERVLKSIKAALAEVRKMDTEAPVGVETSQ